MPEGQTISRWAASVTNDAEIQLPNIEGYEYVVTLLESAGTIIQTGMGIAPLTWQEIESWERLFFKEITCREASFWELTLLKDMSYAYCAELGNATDKKREPPFKVAVLDREDVSRRIRNAFMAFKLK